MAIWVRLPQAILAFEEDYNRLGSHFYICFSFIPPSATGRDALAALAPAADPPLLLQQISNQIQHGGTTNGSVSNVCQRHPFVPANDANLSK